MLVVTIMVICGACILFHSQSDDWSLCIGHKETFAISGFVTACKKKAENYFTSTAMYVFKNLCGLQSVVYLPQC